jgi:hypothetical protein
VGEVCVINEVLGGRARRHLGVRPAPDAEDPAPCPDVVLRRSHTQPRLGLADNSERWTVQGKWPRPLWVPGSRALAPGASSTPAGSPRRRAIGESKRFFERWRTLPDRSIATSIAGAERSVAAFATV